MFRSHWSINFQNFADFMLGPGNWWRDSWTTPINQSFGGVGSNELVLAVERSLPLRVVSDVMLVGRYGCNTRSILSVLDLYLRLVFVLDILGTIILTLSSIVKCNENKLLSFLRWGIVFRQFPATYCLHPFGELVLSDGFQAKGSSASDIDSAVHMAPHLNALFNRALDIGLCSLLGVSERVLNGHHHVSLLAMCSRRL